MKSAGSAVFAAMLATAAVAWGSAVTAAQARVPPTAPGGTASPDSTFLLEVKVVSEAGERLSGAFVEAHALGSEGSVAAGTVVQLRPEGQVHVGQLSAGVPYRIIVQAWGHERTVRVVEVAGETARFLRVVLPLDPYLLPEIEAKASGSPVAGLAGRSVQRVRFADRPLVYGSVGEWLAEQPGVTIRQRGAGGRQAVTVRGSRPEGVLVLLDGAPMNDPLTGRADLSLLPPSTLETATLVRGVGSASHGPGAGAAVLLLTSRVPDGRAASGSLAVSSFGGRFGNAYASAVGRRGRASLSVAVTEAENDYPYQNRLLPGAPTERRGNSDYRSVNSAVSGGMGPVLASVRLDRAERGVPGRMGTSIFESARWSEHGWTAFLSAESAGARLNASMHSRRQVYVADAESPESVLSSREWRVSGRTAVGDRLGILLSGRFSHESVTGDELGKPAPRTMTGGSLERPVRAGRLLLEPAVGVDVTRGAWAVSPGLALRLVPASAWSMWVRAGRGFRLPTFGDLFFASAYRVQPNPDLVPETVRLDAEVGVEAELGRGGWRFDWALDVYYRRTADPIVWLASATAVWSPRNLGDLLAWGVELDGSLKLGRAEESGWRLRLSGSLDRSRLGFGSNRNPLPYQPEVSGFMAAERWSPWGSLRLTLRSIGSRTTSVAATRRLPAFTVVDVSLTRRIPIRLLALEIMLRVENVLDRRFEMIELFPEPGRRFHVRLQVR